jgi:hypothetical protein
MGCFAAFSSSTPQVMLPDFIQQDTGDYDSYYSRKDDKTSDDIGKLVGDG